MIKRDGKVNLWQKTGIPYRRVNKAERKKVYDVIIIGGGITVTGRQN